MRTRFCRGTPPPAAWTRIPEAIAHWKFPEIHCTGEISEDTPSLAADLSRDNLGGFLLSTCMYLVKIHSAWHLQVFTCICTTQRTDSVTSFTCNKSWYTLLKYTLTTRTRLVQEQTLMVFFLFIFCFLCDMEEVFSLLTAPGAADFLVKYNPVVPISDRI